MSEPLNFLEEIIAERPFVTVLVSGVEEGLAKHIDGELKLLTIGLNPPDMEDLLSNPVLSSFFKKALSNRTKDTMGKVIQTELNHLDADAKIKLAQALIDTGKNVLCKHGFKAWHTPENKQRVVFVKTLEEEGKFDGVVHMSVMRLKPDELRDIAMAFRGDYEGVTVEPPVVELEGGETTTVEVVEDFPEIP